ncbi:MAG TPA: hypothetical protein VIO38_08985 [Rariglobus sp.]
MAESRGREVPGTVTVLSPLTVVVDGATVSCPADKHAEVTALVVGARVQVQDRSPRRPLVTGTIEQEGV